MVENSLRNEEPLSPKLAKIGPLIVHLNNKFSSVYKLARGIAIDESLQGPLVLGPGNKDKGCVVWN